jgi:hypothetical protein
MLSLPAYNVPTAVAPGHGVPQDHRRDVAARWLGSLARLVK